jgi:alkylhydroperoxidase family enzyme
MSFETISLLLSWMEMGALLAILFRLSSTFDLIANTQCELRRAIHHLGDYRAAERSNADDLPYLPF